MRDYISCLSASKASIKNWVSLRRDIDWWAETIVHFLSKGIFLILILFVGFLISKFVESLSNSEQFPLQKISVVGAVSVTQDQDIERALADIKGQSFFDIDINEVARKVEGLPWVSSVLVKRRWPAELELTVAEHQPIIRWGDAEVMDNQGHRFVKAAHLNYTNLPKIEGIDGSEFVVLDAYFALSDQFEQLAELGVDKFIQNEQLSFELHLKSGTVIKFGREDYHARLARFVKAYQSGNIPDLNKVKGLDFRYNKGFAVQWKEAYLPKPKSDTVDVAAETRI